MIFQLSPTQTEFFKNSPETGMGFQAVSEEKVDGSTEILGVVFNAEIFVPLNAGFMTEILHLEILDFRALSSDPRLSRNLDLKLGDLTILNLAEYAKSPLPQIYGKVGFELNHYNVQKEIIREDYFVRLSPYFVLEESRFTENENIRDGSVLVPLSCYNEMVEHKYLDWRANFKMLNPALPRYATVFKYLGGNFIEVEVINYSYPPYKSLIHVVEFNGRFERVFQTGINEMIEM